MKRIKIGAVVIFLIVAVYFMISYGIFFFKKPSIDSQLESTIGMNIEKNLKKQSDEVIIQRVINGACQHEIEPNEFPIDFIVTTDHKEVLPQILSDKAQEFMMTSDVMDNEFVIKAENIESEKKFRAQPDNAHSSYSFVTMPAEMCEIDQEIQQTLDMLIGNDLDEFVKLVLQSNNNIVSKEACRSCSIYAFFNGIKHHKQLNVDDIRILQSLLANLYHFVEKMKNLSKTPMLRPEQYDGLQDLNRTQAARNDIKLRARRAATSAALKKLQAIKYNR